MSEYVIKNVSGAIASFSDGADDVPLSSCIASVNSNLAGVNSVTINHTGRNLFGGTIVNYAYYGGKITSGSSYRSFYIKVIPGETYTISRTIIEGNRFRVYATIEEPANNVSLYDLDITHDDAMNLTVTIPTGYNWLFVYLSNNGDTCTVSNYMVEYGSTSHIVEAYAGETKTASLGRTIYGGSVDVVNGIAKPTNVIDISGIDENNGYLSGRWISSINMGNNNSDWHVTEYLPIESNIEYTLSGIAYGNQPALCFYDENKVFISGIAYSNRTSFTFTSPNNAKYARFSIRYDFTEFMLEKGATASAYSPYFEPFTFTPTPITSYFGDNNVWCNTGDIEVSYYSFVETTNKYLIQADTIIEIADKIRNKTCTTAPIEIEKFSDMILKLVVSIPPAEEESF